MHASRGALAVEGQDERDIVGRRTPAARPSCALRADLGMRARRTTRSHDIGPVLRPDRSRRLARRAGAAAALRLRA